MFTVGSLLCVTLLCIVGNPKIKNFCMIKLEEQIKKAGLSINQGKTMQMRVSRSRRNERNTLDDGDYSF